MAVARWDPFNVLCLPHDPAVGWLRVWRAYRVRLRRVWRVRGGDERAVQAHRVRVAYQAVRTRERRCQVLADLAVQPGWWRTFTDPDVIALAEAALPPLLPAPGVVGLVEACDRRALAREAAALRLERAAAGVWPWPGSWAGRVWWGLWHGRAGGR
jgi:hypothetical protein